jgi:hypothetical protein
VRRHGRSRALVENQSSKSLASFCSFEFCSRRAGAALWLAAKAEVLSFELELISRPNYCRKEAQKPQKTVASSLRLEISAHSANTTTKTFCVFCAFLRLFVFP